MSHANEAASDHPDLSVNPHPNPKVCGMPGSLIWSLTKQQLTGASHEKTPQPTYLITLTASLSRKYIKHKIHMLWTVFALANC